MNNKERFDVPKPVERLSEREQMQRLYHQLGVIYSRVFLTGDWEEPDLKQDNRIRNVFEEVPSIQSRDILATDVHEFVRTARMSVPAVLTPEGMMTKKGRHDFNRSAFLGVLGFVGDILKQSAKEIGMHNNVDMMKCIDENIHYFRDVPPNLQRGKEKVSIEDEEEGVSEGLLNIKQKLSEIVESYE